MQLKCSHADTAKWPRLFTLQEVCPCRCSACRLQVPNSCAVAVHWALIRSVFLYVDPSAYLMMLCKSCTVRAKPSKLVLNAPDSSA